jgi:acetyl esterase/lipase
MRYSRVMKYAFAVLLAVLIAGGYAYNNSKPSLQTVSNFDYYVPLSPNNTLAILLHGGSWQTGGRDQLFWVGKYLSKNGISAVTMSYRLAPQFQFDAPLVDIAAVISEIETNKQSYEIDDNYKLIILGFSAGGHLATQFCLNEDSYGVRQADLCIGLAGIYDLDRVIAGKDGPLLIPAVKDFLGMTDPKIASPTYNVTESEISKFLLFWGTDDTVVSGDQIRGFQDALNRHNVPVAAHVIDQRDHLSIFTTISENDEVGQIILETIQSL